MDAFSPQTLSTVSPEHESPKRRSSSRFLSKSVQRGLRQLKKDEHDQRVADLVKKNAIFYKRQKICESFTTFTIIFCFTRKLPNAPSNHATNFYMFSVLNLSGSLLRFWLLLHAWLQLDLSEPQHDEEGGGEGEADVQDWQVLGVVQVNKEQLSIPVPPVCIQVGAHG